MCLKKGILILAVACICTGCAGPSSASGTSQGNPAGAGAGQESKNEDRNPSGISIIDAEGDWKEIEPGSVYDGEISIHVPEASGTTVYGEDGFTVDASHTDDGYIMVKYEGAVSALKLRVILGESQYTYDLNTEGQYEVFPLQMGNGLYEVKIFQHVEGTRYTPLQSVQFEVNMPDTDRVFVFPSQYVWYTNADSAVKLSYDLCGNLTDNTDKAERIYNYIVNLMSYDYELAATVESGYIPDLEQVLKNKKGICFDYSALYASMLRAQDIPVRLVIGYVQPENIYHAWNQVYLDGKWVWKDPTFGPGDSHKEDNYAQEREY